MFDDADAREFDQKHGTIHRPERHDNNPFDEGSEQYYLDGSKYALGLALDHYEAQIPDHHVRKIIEKCRDVYNALGTPEATVAIGAAREAGLDYVRDPATRAIPEHIRNRYDTQIKNLYSITLAAYWCHKTGDWFREAGYYHTVLRSVDDINDDEIRRKIEAWKKER